MKTCVIIPTYNEENTIGPLLEKILSQHLDVLVVDDGSTDNSFNIAKDKGVRIIKNDRNLGKGASLIKAFDYVMKNDFDAAITMDADGQHLPTEIPDFINEAQKSPGIVIGNRMSKRRNMPFIRVMTNKFMSWLISELAGQKIPDTQCGFRLIKKDVLKNVNLHTAKFETESEILIEAARLGFKISSIPIETVYTNERSHINPWTDTLRFFKFISRYFKR